MRLKVEAKVSSSVALDELMEMKHMPYIISMVPSRDGILEKIIIERGVTDYEEHLPKVETSGNQLTGFIFPKEDFLAEQKKLLQHLESFGALDLGIREISWNNLQVTWLPETEEERLQVPLLSYRKDISYAGNSTPLTLGWLQSTVIHRRMVEPLVIPLSFFRKGTNHYERLEYIEAFLAFYLMLEGVFGGGHTKNAKVEQAFMASDKLDYAIGQTFRMLENQHVQKQWLIDNLNSKGWPYDKEGLVKLLVDQRGNLSHYSLKSSRKQRNYFEDKDYQPLASIIGGVARFATIKLRLAPFRGEMI